MVEEEHLVATKRVVASLPISSCNLHEKYNYKHHLFNVNGSSSSTSSVSRSCQGCTSDLIMLKSQLVKEIQEGSLLYNKATTGEILKWEMTANQLFVHTRVSDSHPYPDLNGSALIWVAGSGSGSAFKLRIRIQEGKNDPQK